MPSFIKGKDGERAWSKAKRIIGKQYPKIDKDSDRFYRLVTTVYKSVCKSKDFDCGQFESINEERKMERFSELLGTMYGDEEDYEKEAGLGRTSAYSVESPKNAAMSRRKGKRNPKVHEYSLEDGERGMLTKPSKPEDI